MATYPVFLEVDYLDSAERTASVEYRLQLLYDDGAANFAAIQANAASVVSALKLLSWSEITAYRVRVAFDGGDTPANVAANNQVRAFVRTHTASGLKTSFEVVAWDDAVYDQNNQNMLSAAFLLAAQDVTDNLADRETGEAMTVTDYAQSRTRKSRNIVND